MAAGQCPSTGTRKRSKGGLFRFIANTASAIESALECVFESPQCRKRFNQNLERSGVAPIARAIADSAAAEYGAACAKGAAEGAATAIITGAGAGSTALVGCGVSIVIKVVERKNSEKGKDLGTAYRVFDITVVVARAKTRLARAIYERWEKRVIIKTK